MFRYLGFWRIVVFGLVITPIMIAICLLSVGAGEGTYVLAKVFFPYTMLSAGIFGEITNVFFGVAILQFPVYSLLLAAFCTTSSRFNVMAFVLICFHVLAVILSFLLADGGFSG